ncbi:MAG: PIG-L family deacetylase [Planctomycetes bacterium]|nr:PIG-L family deacetylase [Planctomycetota bacterium]
MKPRKDIFMPAAIAWAMAFLCVRSSIVLADQGGTAQVEGLPRPKLTLAPADRLLILAPHPDDEVLGCGGVIQQGVALGLPIRIVFLTYGDFYEWSFIRYEKRPVLTPRGVEGMGEIRHGEALAADATLGAPAADLVFLGYPDFGTLQMWYRAWDGARPVRGRLSRATAVPYQNAFRPGAPYKGDEVLKDLTTILREFRPTKVFVSHPADHHPDHKAFYLFARVALFDLAPAMTPRVYPYLVHYTKWPVPFGFHPAAPLEPPAFLKDRIPWEVIALDGRQVGIKRDALKKHKTQYETTPRFLDSFVRRNELFGDFPPIALSGQAVPPPARVSRESEGLTPVTQEERGYLVGVVMWTAKIEGETLVFSIRLSRPLAREVGCSVYLFGYRGATPFPEMPKLHVVLGELTHEVFDGGREVASREIRVHRAGRDIQIRVPLTTLRRPQKVFATAQMHAGPVPLDWTSWRILEIADATAPGD